MIDHIYLPVTDIDRSLDSYGAALTPNGSQHVAVKPRQHRVRSTLELKVAAPSRFRAPDPLQLFIGHGNVVVYRLDVLWLGEYVVVNLVEERWNTDALGPLLWDPFIEPDPRARAQKQVEVIEAIADAQHFEAAFGDVAGGGSAGERRGT
jgi:hypothetical protein